MNEGVLLIGGGGHASVLLEILIEQKVNVLGYVSPTVAANRTLFSNLHWLKLDEDILQFDNSIVKLINGIGSLPGNSVRADLYRRYKKLGYNFATVISQKADVSKYAHIEEGVQVMRGAIVQTGVRIGYNSIVNTGAIVDHDCHIGNNNHIAPGVTLSGCVKSRDNVHFGTASSVIQSVFLGENVVLGAGVSINKNVEANTICFPAPITKKVRK
jgi:sugar O-acyltransferase (sialic acid O-acetyltransferase NeuD family)